VEYFDLPEQIALLGYSRGAKARVVRVEWDDEDNLDLLGARPGVGTITRIASVLVETEPPHPQWVVCGLTADGWVELGS